MNADWQASNAQGSKYSVLKQLKPTGANYSRRLWAVREIKATCGDGPEDILGVAGDKSDIVTLILDQVCLCWLLAFCPRSRGDIPS